MKLTDVISDSMSDDLFFGLPKQVASFIATSCRKVVVEGKDILYAPQVFRVDTDGRHYPHTFTLEDILNVEWETKDSSGIISTGENMHSGVAEVDEDSMKLLVTLFETEGYGIIDSFEEINGGKEYRLWMRSTLFTRVKSGTSTPMYIFEYDIDTKTLKANRI